MTKTQKTFAVLCAITVICGIIFFMISSAPTTYAVASIMEEDGRYEMSYQFGGQSGIGKQMLEKYFDKTAVVEKIGDGYYFSFTQLSSSMKNLSLNIEEGKQVGYRVIEVSANKKTYSYTLSKDNLQKALPFSVYVSARGETFSFTITLNLSSARKVGEVEDLTTERPAQFVPVISTTSGSEYQATIGQTFVIREATASLGKENLDIMVKAYYVQGGEKIEIIIDQNKLVLERVGEYNIVYRAESLSYKTSLGKPTYIEKVVKISSSKNDNRLAKIYDENGALDKETTLLASKIESDNTIYKMAASKMATIADKFQVFGIELLSSDGQLVEPNGKVMIGLKANSTYNRNEVVAYLLEEDGTLTKLNSTNGGSYINVEIYKSGTIILCVPGLAFHMPVWGYVLILVGAVVIVGGGGVAIFLIARRKKQKQK